MALTIATTDVERVVQEALAEDIGSGDVTTQALFGADATARADIWLKEPGVVAGLDVAEHIFHSLDPDARFEAVTATGERIESAPLALATVAGATRALLSGERVALNLLGRLCGIATLTRAYVDAVAGTSAVILDTRKTTPGLRSLEKQAVRAGGGRNHRLGLFDGILVKDNHLRLAGGVRAAVERIRDAGTGLAIEVEAETLDDVRDALAAGAEAILLDNMPVEQLREAVALVERRAWLEASGGVSLATVRDIASTGVDAISVGALTHSARSLDVSLEVAQ